MKARSTVKHPALIWQGSKWRLAPWIISFFPRHDAYVEPFGGGANILLRKEPTKLDVYNDLNGDAVNFFRTLRNPDTGPELIRRIRLTPYARDEFYAGWEAFGRTDGDPVERARLFWALNRLGIGMRGGGIGRLSRRGFAFSAPTRNPVSAVVNASDGLSDIVERLRGVIIENDDAMKLFPRFDGASTLFYVDPPYNKDFTFSYTSGAVNHEEMLDVLNGVSGFVVLSGYDSELYRETLAGWHVETREVGTFVRTRRTECLWLSPRTWDALQEERVAAGQEVSHAS